MSSKPESKTKKLRRRYNSIVKSAVAIHDTVGTLSDTVTTEKPNNPVLQTKTNSEFAECLKGMADEGEYMLSKEFVINNIEHLHPSTLKRILNRKGAQSKGKPTKVKPEKYTRMDDYDAMVILKWLVGGCSAERIRDHYPGYTVRQINNVLNDFRRLRTEKVTTNMPSMLSQLRRMAWF
jgi:hypothetical protein